MAQRWASVAAWLEHHGLSKHVELLEQAEIDLEVCTYPSEGSAVRAGRVVTVPLRTRGPRYLRC